MIVVAMALLSFVQSLIGPTNRVAESVPQVLAATNGYDAIDARGKRKTPAVDRRSEDQILNVSGRSQLLANARDIHRNYALAAWAVRRHLDYVSTFGFQSQTDDQVFNKELEAMVAEHDARIDVAGRHRFAKIVRLLEARAVLDGDCGLLLIDSEDGKVQGIEGDRIRDVLPSVGLLGSWVHGVRVDEMGKALEYAIAKRTVSGMVFERSVPAKWMLIRGYYDRFDQVRGISPLSAGLNSLRDTYENVDYALAKAKISQLLGFKVTRTGSSEFAPTDTDDQDTGDDKYKIDFGRGPVFLDMDPGEDADFINAATPTNEFREFMLTVIQLTLKSLDIPYSFYDESHTNFFGSVGAINHYKRSAADKIADNQTLLDKEKQWRFSLWIRDGKLTLPKGLDLTRPFWKHISVGMPWWKPTEEIAGIGAAISMGLNNPLSACEEHNTDFYDNIDATAKALEYSTAKLAPYGMTLSFNPPAQVPPAESADDEANKKPATKDKA